MALVEQDFVTVGHTAMVAAKAVDANVVAALRHKLVQPDTSLSQKYRILFSLRSIPGPAAEEAIVEGESV